MKTYLEKIFILEGIILGILGVLFFMKPIESFMSFTTICGVFLVAAGIIRLVRAFKSSEKIYFILTAGIDILFGLIIWLYPIVTTTNLIFVFGVWALIKGVYNVIIYIKNKEFGFNWETAMAVISTILGLIVFIYPITTIAVLPFIPYIMGTFLIVIAISEICIGFKIR